VHFHQRVRPRATRDRSVELQADQSKLVGLRFAQDGTLGLQQPRKLGHCNRVLSLYQPSDREGLNKSANLICIVHVSKVRKYRNDAAVWPPLKEALGLENSERFTNRGWAHSKSLRDVLLSQLRARSVDPAEQFDPKEFGHHVGLCLEPGRVHAAAFY
jgi:hypothetical protein